MIVDCQPGFKSARDKTLHSEIIGEIKRAIRYRSLIVFVEYEGHGDTFETIYNECKFYDKVVRCCKVTDDGSINILDQMFKEGYNYKNIKDIRVCGVNTNYCVRETCNGLRSLLPKARLTLLAQACRCMSKKTNYDWATTNNIRVI